MTDNIPAAAKITSKEMAIRFTQVLPEKSLWCALSNTSYLTADEGENMRGVGGLDDLL